MNLRFGTAITPAEVERLVSSWGDEGPGRFAVFCDAVAGWEAFRVGGVPLTTGRRSVPDGGVDIWIHLDADQARQLSPGTLLREGRNVIQVKFKSVLSGNPGSRLSALKTAIRGGWNDVSEFLKAEPDRYLLFTNLDLSRPEKDKLVAEILDATAEPASIRSRVEVVDASALALFMNERRSLLAGFFWERPGVALSLFRKQQFRLYGVPESSAMVGRDAELHQIREHLSQPGGRVALLLGGPGTGKTRLAIEALEPWVRNAVVVEEAADAAPGFLQELETTEPCVLLVEEPSRDRLQAWVRRALASETAKVVITLRTERRPSLGSVAADERFQEWSLKALPAAMRSDLVRAVAPGLDPILRSWIAEHSAEALDMLVVAAGYGEKLRGRSGSLRSKLSQELLRDAEDRLDPELLDVLRRLSLLTRVHSTLDEIPALARIPVSGSEIEILPAQVRALVDAGFLEDRDGTLTVVPAFRGEVLFEDVLRREPDLLPRAFESLPGKMLYRLLERASRAHAENIWTRALDPRVGLFPNLETFERLGPVLALAVDASPLETMQLLEARLSEPDPMSLMALNGEGRRHVMWTLESLLTLPETAPRAARLVANLAAAETETYGNRATAILGQALRPLTPWYGLDGESRRKLVEELRGHAAAEVRATLARGLRDALQDPFRPGALPRPLSSGPGAWDWERQQKELPDLVKAYVSALLDLANDKVSEVREAARAGLPSALTSTTQHFPEALLDRLAGLLIGMLGEPEAPVSRPEIREWLLRARTLALAPASLQKLESALEDSSLESRLRNLLDTWPPFESDRGHAAWQQSLSEVAAELLNRRAELPHVIWKSLTAPRAPGAPALLNELALQDPSGLVWPDLVQALRSTPQARWELLGVYLRELEDPLARVQELRDLREENPEAFLLILLRLKPAPGLIDEVLRTLTDAPPLRRRWVGGLLPLKLWDGLAEEQAARLLHALAGPDQDTPDAALAAASYLYLNEPPPPDLAASLAGWLAQGIPVEADVNVHDLDRLARRLAETDLERGFGILQGLLQTPGRILTWNPLANRGEDSFWSLLLQSDARRALSMAFETEQRWGDEGALIGHALRRGLDPAQDSAEMLKFAALGEAEANFIAGTLEPEFSLGDDRGFWSVAARLIESHPLPSQVSRGLLGSVLLGPMSRAGTEEDHRLKALNWARVTLAESQGPATEAWLQALVAELEGRPVPRVIWEYDLPRDEFLHILQDPGSPDHRWAMERLVREAPWEEIRQHVTVDELRTLLPEVELPARKKRALMTAMEVWSRHG